MVDTAGNQLPYISRFSEDYVKENEVRLLKAINAEFDYKSQSVQLPAAPMLLEHRQKGDYSVDLRPTISMPTFGFNVTSADPEKRKLFSDLRFRQAMSVAITSGGGAVTMSVAGSLNVWPEGLRIRTR